MNWNRTKTIFIITFLLLNVFLTFQLIQKNDHYQMSSIPEMTLQERLNTNNITIDTELPEVDSDDHHIIGRNQPFTDQHLDYLGDNQVTQVSEDGKILTSLLQEPFPLTEGQFSQDLTNFLINHVNGGADYRFGHYDQSYERIYLYQAFNGHTAYSDEYAPLIIHLNEEREIVKYEQRYIEFEEHGSESEILSSLKAIEVLLNLSFIGIGDTITSIEYGYHNRYTFENEDLMYAPMWLVTLSNDESYLIHAIEGDVQNLTVEEEEET